MAGAVLSWGAYGALLHLGQTQLGNPLKALLCVGAAYFLIGVIIPVFALSSQGALSNFNTSGLITATIAGALGAAGAACIIWAFRTGGLPVYVMPLVFGGAPIVNVLVSMVIHPPKAVRSTRSCTPASCSSRSAQGWCCTSGRRREPRLDDASPTASSSAPVSLVWRAPPLWRAPGCGSGCWSARPTSATSSTPPASSSRTPSIRSRCSTACRPSWSAESTASASTRRACGTWISSAPGYYFLATDTPHVMRWLAGRAEDAGVQIAYQTPFTAAQRTPSGFNLGDAGTTRFIVGADGPSSHVARAFGLGLNTKFLFGVEHEYGGVELQEPDRLHCFLDRRLAPGYIGWVVAGVGIVQIGLAGRVQAGRLTATEAMAPFLDKIAPIVDVRRATPVSIRAGMIPCGGAVDPVAARRVMLVGDAAGMVSPVTAGGIHTALKHGLAAGYAIADFLSGKTGDPSDTFVRSYPRFDVKRILRFLFDHCQSDAAFDLLLGHTADARRRQRRLLPSPGCLRHR